MARALPPLVALRAFEAVGRLGSVGRAADELCVSHSVVSRHVSNLEQRLGVTLFAPQGRSIVLTPAGAAYLSRITRAFDAIGQATEELTPKVSSQLEIWCVPGLANRALLRHLTGLEAALPGSEIRLQPTLSRPDLAAGQADAEIVYLFEPETRPGCRAALIARPRVFPVASPFLLARFPEADRLDRLPSLPLIHEESTEQWERWLEAAGEPAQSGLRGMRLWHAHLAIEAARLGQGVALANDFLVADEIGGGGLVEIGATEVRLGGYYIVAAENRWNEAGIQAIREWLAALFAPATIVAE